MTLIIILTPISYQINLHPKAIVLLQWMGPWLFPCCLSFTVPFRSGASKEHKRSSLFSCGAAMAEIARSLRHPHDKKGQIDIVFKN